MNVLSVALQFSCPAAGGTVRWFFESYSGECLSAACLRSARCRSLRREKEEGFCPLDLPTP